MTAGGNRHEFDRRVVRTKKAIKTALLSIMEEKDISCITISELTRKAGINRRTFYTHYRSITDIIDEIENDMVKALSEIMLKIDVSNIRQSAYNVFMELDEVVTMEFDYYFRRMRMDLRGIFMTRMKTLVKEFAEKLSGGNLRGEFADTASAFIVGGFFNVFLEWRSQADRVPAERAARLTGILSEHCVESLQGVVL